MPPGIFGPEEEVWGEMITRIIVGAVTIPVFILIVASPLFGGRLFYVFVCLLLLVASVELRHLLENKAGKVLPPGLYYSLFFLFPTCAWLFAERYPLLESLAYLGGVFFVSLFIPFLRARKLEASDLGPLSASLIGIFLFSYCPSHFILLKKADPDGAFIILGLLFAWIVDAVAYFSGVIFGKHPAGLLLSPKKTWEGFYLGGILSGGLMVWIMMEAPRMKIFGLEIIFSPAVAASLELYLVTTIALIFVVLVSLSDLWESFFKRYSNVKDSGGVLPGHGGILDALDSSFVTAFAMCYLCLILNTA